MGYLADKLKKRGSKYYYIDWITDIALAITFIYLSFQVREMMLHCTCPSQYNITNITPILLNNTTTIGGMK
jgi:hypothetical protein